MFPSFSTSPLSLSYTFVSATIPSPSASSGSITISMNPIACSDVKYHSFTFSLTDSINSDVIITVNINVLDPLPSFSFWNSVLPTLNLG